MRWQRRKPVGEYIIEITAMNDDLGPPRKCLPDLSSKARRLDGLPTYAHIPLVGGIPKSGEFLTLPGLLGGRLRRLLWYW